MVSHLASRLSRSTPAVRPTPNSHFGAAQMITPTHCFQIHIEPYARTLIAELDHGE